MSKKQPEALRLAKMLTADEWPGSVTLVSYARECVAELLRLHAENETLRASHGQAPAGAGEPFCWHWENTFNGGMGAMKKNPETLGINMSHPDYKWTALYTAPQPSPTAQAASSAVLKAIREANMQLVRTGDNAFMLVPYKVATAQAAESVPVLPDFDTVEQHIYGACRRYITRDMLEPIHNLIRDAIDADRAARAPADSVQEDADKDREDLMHCFWVAMRGCETAADDDNNPVLRIQVEGFYQLWNRLNDQVLQPAWTRRAAMAANGGNKL